MATTDNSHNQIISLLGEIRGVLTSGQSNAALDSLVREIDSLRSEMRNSFQQLIALLSTQGSD
jgi:hypothetical protein